MHLGNDGTNATSVYVLRTPGINRRYLESEVGQLTRRRNKGTPVIGGDHRVITEKERLRAEMPKIQWEVLQWLRGGTGSSGDTGHTEVITEGAEVSTAAGRGNRVSGILAPTQ